MNILLQKAAPGKLATFLLLWNSTHKLSSKKQMRVVSQLKKPPSLLHTQLLGYL